jgi:phosphoglycolate phosphatase-like HAD superfamily hydrolase
MIKCVVFDFDGTLVDSNEIKREVFFEVARPWDSSDEVVAEVFERCPAANRYEKTREIAKGLITRKLLPGEPSLERWSIRLADDYTAKCEAAIACCREMPGATAALEILFKTGLQLFVNSATPVVPLQRLTQLRNWDQYFQAAYGAEATKAENLQSIARASGSACTEMVHVGDQLDDQNGAKHFGCHFVAMTAGIAASPVRKNPLIVEDLRDLPALLDNISREAS